MQGQSTKHLLASLIRQNSNNLQRNQLSGTAESTALVYTLAQKRIDDNKEEDDDRVVVINNGTGVQVIVLQDNEDNQERFKV